MKKILLYGLLGFLAVAFPIASYAAFNDVTFTEGVSIIIPSTGKTYTLDSGAGVEAFTINNDSISFDVEVSTSFTLESTDRDEFSVGGGCQIVRSCTSALSSITVSCSTSETITVTPSTDKCDSSSGGASSGGGGGGGAGPGPGANQTPIPTVTIPATPTPTPTPTPTTGQGCPLMVESAYKHGGSSTVFYITASCTKREFRNAPTYFTYFPSFDAVTKTSKENIDRVPNDAVSFMPKGPLYDPKYGALVKVLDDAKVYVLGTKLNWITSEAIYEGLGYQWSWIEDVSHLLLAKYSVGGEITSADYHPNFTLIKYADSPRVYRLEPDPADATRQVKRFVVSPEVFDQMRLRWDRIVTVEDNEMYPDGENLNAAVLGLTIEYTHAVFKNTLSIGSVGDEVRQLQTKLREMGYYPNDTDISGYFGSVTEKAVQALQKARGLDPLGIVGPKTRALLNS